MVLCFKVLYFKVLYENVIMLFMGIKAVVLKKGKRKLIYNETFFYWYVRKNLKGISRVHVLSEDKRIKLEFPPFDRELPVTPKEIKVNLKRYFGI